MHVPRFDLYSNTSYVTIAAALREYARQAMPKTHIVHYTTHLWVVPFCGSVFSPPHASLPALLIYSALFAERAAEGFLQYILLLETRLVTEFC